MQNDVCCTKKLMPLSSKINDGVGSNNNYYDCIIIIGAISPTLNKTAILKK